jgi:predicted nucleotide-binding protein
MRKLAVYLGLAADDTHAEEQGRQRDSEFQNSLSTAVEVDISSANRRRVMVIYGHDEEANRALFNWLRAIGLEPMEWSQLVKLSGDASPYVGQVLEQAFVAAQAVLAFFTPDESVIARGASRSNKNSWRLQARPNVLIESGMALVTHPQRTVLVVLGDQELPSDLAGRHYIRLNNTAGPIYELASRLADAGCDVNRTGTQWLDPANFPNRDNLAVTPVQRTNSTTRNKTNG